MIPEKNIFKQPSHASLFDSIRILPIDNLKHILLE